MGHPAVETGTADITDTENHYWGAYVTMTIDPTDNPTLWGVGEFFTTTEADCPIIYALTRACKRQIEVFQCRKGSSLCP
jgi:hypothetical protein